ncbi:MAG: histidine phosphatase family protein [Acutalibacteraceae bacterium]
MAVLIYLLRHGETAYNAEKRYQGVRDIPLSDAGRAKLRRADFSPRTVYVSPLCRARESASILFPTAVQTVVPGLREMCFGAFEGRNYEEMEHDPAYRAWVDGGCMGRCPGGESRVEFSERVCAAFERLADAEVRAGENTLVIAAHGGTQMAVLERYAVPRRDYYAWCAPNGGGYILCADRWQSEKTLELVREVRYEKD